MLVAFGLAGAAAGRAAGAEAAALRAPALPADARALLIGAADARRRGDLRAALHLLRDAVARAPVPTPTPRSARSTSTGRRRLAADHLRSAVEGIGESRAVDGARRRAGLRPDPVGAAAARPRGRGGAWRRCTDRRRADERRARMATAPEYLGRGRRARTSRSSCLDGWDGDLFL
jgi:hypothetical protein